MLIFGSRHQGVFEIVAKNLLAPAGVYLITLCDILPYVWGFCYDGRLEERWRVLSRVPFVTRMMLGYSFRIADHLAPHAGWKGVQRSGNCTDFLFGPGSYVRVAPAVEHK